MFWGANGHPFSAYQGVSFDQQIDLLKGLGMDHYRVNVWGDPAQMDSLLAVAKAKSFPRITPCLYLSIPQGSGLDAIYQSNKMAAVTAAQRWGWYCPTFEVGNENENPAIAHKGDILDNGIPYNIAWGPAGGVGALDYIKARWDPIAAAMRGMGDGIKSVNANIKVAIGTAGWGHTGAFERMATSGVHWDVSVWHNYQPFAKDEWAMKVLHDKWAKPIWWTEWNISGGTQYLSESDHASQLVAQAQAIKAAAATYNIAGAFVYELLDEPWWGNGGETHYGLVKVVKDAAGHWTNGGNKLAYAALRKVIVG